MEKNPILLFMTKNRDRNRRGVTESIDNIHVITAQESKRLSLSPFMELRQNGTLIEHLLSERPSKGVSLPQPKL